MHPELGTLYAMIRNTNKYISKMNRLYAQFAKKELQLLSFSNDHTALKELTTAYFQLDPLYLCNDVVEQRRVAMFSNWVALTIAHIIKKQTTKEGSMYDGLLTHQKFMNKGKF